MNNYSSIIVSINFNRINSDNRSCLSYIKAFNCIINRRVFIITLIWNMNSVIINSQNTRIKFNFTIHKSKFLLSRIINLNCNITSSTRNTYNNHRMITINNIINTNSNFRVIFTNHECFSIICTWKILSVTHISCMDIIRSVSKTSNI